MLSWMTPQPQPWFRELLAKDDTMETGGSVILPPVSGSVKKDSSVDLPLINGKPITLLPENGAQAALTHFARKTVVFPGTTDTPKFGSGETELSALPDLEARAKIREILGVDAIKPWIILIDAPTNFLFYNEERGLGFTYYVDAARDFIGLSKKFFEAIDFSDPDHRALFTCQLKRMLVQYERRSALKVVPHAKLSEHLANITHSLEEHFNTGQEEYRKVFEEHPKAKEWLDHLRLKDLEILRAPNIEGTLKQRTVDTLKKRSIFDESISSGDLTNAFEFSASAKTKRSFAAERGVLQDVIIELNALIFDYTSRGLPTDAARLVIEVANTYKRLLTLDPVGFAPLENQYRRAKMYFLSGFKDQGLRAVYALLGRPFGIPEDYGWGFPVPMDPGDLSYSVIAVEGLIKRLRTRWANNLLLEMVAEFRKQTSAFKELPDFFYRLETVLDGTEVGVQILKALMQLRPPFEKQLAAKTGSEKFASFLGLIPTRDDSRQCYAAPSLLLLPTDEPLEFQKGVRGLRLDSSILFQVELRSFKPVLTITAPIGGSNRGGNSITSIVEERVREFVTRNIPSENAFKKFPIIWNLIEEREVEQKPLKISSQSPAWNVVRQHFGLGTNPFHFFKYFRAHASDWGHCLGIECTMPYGVDGDSKLMVPTLMLVAPDRTFSLSPCPEQPGEFRLNMDRLILQLVPKADGSEAIHLVQRVDDGNWLNELLTEFSVNGMNLAVALKSNTVAFEDVTPKARDLEVFERAA